MKALEERQYEIYRTMLSFQSEPTSKRSHRHSLHRQLLYVQTRITTLDRIGPWQHHCIILPVQLYFTFDVSE